MTDIHKPSLYFFRNQVHFLKDNFHIDDQGLFEKFNSFVGNFCYFTLEMDKMIDGENNYKHLFETGKNTPFLAIKSYQESIRTLTQIFPDHPEFWNELDKQNQHFYSTLLKEKYNTAQQPVFTLQDFEEYAVGKHTLAYVPITALSIIFESKHNIEKLKDIFTLIFKGIQMNDDLEDLQKDIQNNQWTYARSRVEEFIRENHLSNESGLDRFEERVLYVSGIAEELIGYSKDHFIAAKDIAKEYHFEELSQWLSETIAGITQNEALILNLTQN